MALKRYEVNGVLVNLSDKDAKARGLDPKKGIPRRPFPKTEAPVEEPTIVSSKRIPRDTTPKTTAGDPVVTTDEGTDAEDAETEEETGTVNEDDETPEPETKTEDETPTPAPAENKKADAPNKARRTRSRG